MARKVQYGKTSPFCEGMGWAEHFICRQWHGGTFLLSGNATMQIHQCVAKGM